jgi:hypothetical protein
VKNLSDGGLLLFAHEPLPPSTSLHLQLHPHHGVRSFEGVVVWNAAGPGAGTSPIAHGIRFTSPVSEGFAVELFLSESFPHQGSPRSEIQPGPHAHWRRRESGGEAIGSGTLRTPIGGCGHFPPRELA